MVILKMKRAKKRKKIKRKKTKRRTKASVDTKGYTKRMQMMTMKEKCKI